jgi:antitoxin (DNA-binding transcriptional repressor) of toxin-antitoxin stability system
MIQLNINEVETNFAATIDRVSRGETVIICKSDKPVAQITQIQQQPKKQRPIGLAAKKYPGFELPDNFNDPLPDDILAYFTGEKE